MFHFGGQFSSSSMYIIQRLKQISYCQRHIYVKHLAPKSIQKYVLMLTNAGYA